MLKLLEGRCLPKVRRGDLMITLAAPQNDLYWTVVISILEIRSYNYKQPKSKARGPPIKLDHTRPFFSTNGHLVAVQYGAYMGFKYCVDMKRNTLFFKFIFISFFIIFYSFSEYLDSNHFHQRRLRTLAEVF